MASGSSTRTTTRSSAWTEAADASVGGASGSRRRRAPRHRRHAGGSGRRRAVRPGAGFRRRPLRSTPRLLGGNRPIALDRPPIRRSRHHQSARPVPDRQPGLARRNAVAGGQHGDRDAARGVRSAHGPSGPRGFRAQADEPGHHYRCYRSKATQRYLLLPKRGVEFLDLAGDDHMRHDWLRAPCIYGVLPSNGMLYLAPHQCVCYQGVLLSNFNALIAGSPADPQPLSWQARLQRGPAWDAAAPGKQAGEDDWPMYRRDPRRSGSIGTRAGRSAAALGGGRGRLRHAAGGGRRAIAGGGEGRPHGPRAGCRYGPDALDVHGRRASRFAAHGPRRLGAVRFGGRLRVLSAGRRR
jgi:hypothetical protein